MKIKNISFWNKIKNDYTENDIYKIQQIITFVDKKNAKKHISLSELIQRINHANRIQRSYTCCYVNDYLLRILNALKQHGFIFAYYPVPVTCLLHFLKFGFKVHFYNRLFIIYLKQNSAYNKALQYIHVISKPSRYIYITYKDLQKLNKKINNTRFYLLNTTKGLLTHTQAVREKIGGQLICRLI